VLDAGLARELDAIFERYVARANEVHLDRWSKRGPAHRLLDNAVYLINEVL